MAPPPIISNSSNLGKSLYRRILKELRATRNFDHHLRDIRFLLWVPGTKGKRQYDELKRLAVMSSSLHATRKSSNPSPAPSSIIIIPDENDSQQKPIVGGHEDNSTTTGSEEPKSPLKKKAINLSPSIADQIRGVARGLFRKEKEKMEQFSSMISNGSSSPPPQSSNTSNITSPTKTPAEIAIAKAKAIQEGTKRAFWAIKRLQDIRAGLVPNASMWLVIQGPGGGVGGLSSSAYQNYLCPPASPAAATARANLLLLAAVTGNSTTTSSSSNSFNNSKSANLPPPPPTKPVITSFDPFVIPKDAQLRTGNFPFLFEFLGIDQEPGSKTKAASRKKKQLQQQTVVPPVLGSGNNSLHVVDPIEEHLEKLGTHGKSKNKVLKLELVSRCAAKEGSSARYHLSFRLENISEFAVDVKLAHLFAINCESPPVLNEMVCLLPLLGNSILSPYSASAFDQNEDEDDDNGEKSTENQNVGDGEKNELNTENLESVPRKRAAKKKGSEQSDENNLSVSSDEDQSVSNEFPLEKEIISDAPHHQFTRKIRINSDSSPSSSAAGNNLASTTASLPYVSASKSSAPDFTAKAKTPDHCAVYDVSVPFQGECVLRGFVLYRTISNSFPSVTTTSQDANNESGSSSASDNGTTKQEQPSSVKSRLKVLHLPLIKLVPSSDEK